MPERHVATSLPNTSSGAGALVRVLGAGLVVLPKDATLVGSIAAAITHGGADGYLSGGALARLVAELVAGEPMDDAIAATSARASGPLGRRCDRAVERHPGPRCCHELRILRSSR